MGPVFNQCAPPPPYGFFFFFKSSRPATSCSQSWHIHRSWEAPTSLPTGIPPAWLGSISYPPSSLLHHTQEQNRGQTDTLCVAWKTDLGVNPASAPRQQKYRMMMGYLLGQLTFNFMLLFTYFLGDSSTFSSTARHMDALRSLSYPSYYFHVYVFFPFF